MIYDYARVLTDGQSVDAQRKQLDDAGTAKVFREVASDVLMVARLNWQARSPRDLLDILATIAAKGARFRSLGDAWADMTTAHGRLMPAVLGVLAESERELMPGCTSEGRQRARWRDVKLRRRPMLTTHQQREAMARRDKGDETLAETACSYNVSVWTVSRLQP